MEENSCNAMAGLCRELRRIRDTDNIDGWFQIKQTLLYIFTNKSKATENFANKLLNFYLRINLGSLLFSTIGKQLLPTGRRDR